MPSQAILLRGLYPRIGALPFGGKILEFPKITWSVNLNSLCCPLPPRLFGVDYWPTPMALGATAFGGG
jgi:hypothetical protein